MTKYLFLTVSGLALICSQVSAQSYSSHPEPLQPRIEAGAKAGTERSMGTMEGWMPIVQDDDSVLYGDIRWMADDEENQEGNLGLGYRAMQGDHIVGVHGWIDRRRTDRGSNFHQITGGVEFLKEDWDVKANAYVPLNKEKEYTTANIGQSNPYMAGTGLFVDTNGTVIEEAQPGGDIELGYRIPAFEKNIDAIRVYGGGYAFIGDQSDDTIGGRVRASVDINPLLNVGARFQYDEPRGSQGFLEATLRFPFTAKKRFQQYGLRARMDESPERDIDIVTGAQVDNGLRKQVISTESGQTQRVIHVDNTAAAGGNGSVENPFNNLTAAQAALQDNDVIYVHRGDGTSSGMNQGIVINKTNVQMIGSGSDFVFDTDKFTTNKPSQKPADGTIIVAAGTAPVITNINSPANANDIYTGNGILVTADKAVITGVTVNGSSFFGINGLADNDAQWESFTVKNVTTSNNNGSGLVSYSLNGSRVDSIIFENNTSSGNTVTVSGGNGIVIATTSPAASVAGSIGNVTVRNNIVNNNSAHGIYVGGASGSSILIENNTVTAPASTTSNGIVLGSFVTNAHINDLVISGNTVSGFKSGTDTGQGGIILNTAFQGTIDNLMISQNDISYSGRALVLSLGNSGTAQIQAFIEDNNIHNNIYYGILSSNMADMRIADNVILGGAQGLYYRAVTGESNIVVNGNRLSNMSSGGMTMNATGSGILSAKLENNTVTGVGTVSSGYGVNIDNDSTGVFNVDLGGGTLYSLGGNRVYGNIYRDIYIDSRPGTAGSTPGTTISAQGNWWGVNTGLDQGTRATFDNGSASPGSSIDSSNYLTSDPGI